MYCVQCTWHTRGKVQYVLHVDGASLLHRHTVVVTRGPLTGKYKAGGSTPATPAMAGVKIGFIGCGKTTRVVAMAVSNVASVRDQSSRPNQPVSFNFLKRKFGQLKPVFRSVQPAWFRKWPWLHYDQVEDKMFCHICLQAFKQGSVSLIQKKKDAFITVRYTNWKDAAGEKSVGFSTHEHSEVGYKLSRSYVCVAFSLYNHKYFLL